MIDLDLLLAVAGVAITVMVVVAMVLIVPSGVEAAPVHRADPVEPVGEPETVGSRAAV